MSEKRFWFVIDKGKLEYVQDNVAGEKITVTDLEDLLNFQNTQIKILKEENEKLRKAEKINIEYAEQIVEENHKFRIAKNSLRRENEQLRKENEQLRTQLLICQQSKNDNGRFQVWEVPPNPKGIRITTSNGEKYE